MHDVHEHDMITQQAVRPVSDRKMAPVISFFARQYFIDAGLELLHYVYSAHPDYIEPTHDNCIEQEPEQQCLPTDTRLALSIDEKTADELIRAFSAHLTIGNVNNIPRDQYADVVRDKVSRAMQMYDSIDDSMKDEKVVMLYKIMQEAETLLKADDSKPCDANNS
jgi:hypothetical protein